MNEAATDHQSGPLPQTVAALAARARHAEPHCGSVRVVCIDGPAGSGKTTLAGALADALGAGVVHLDDLYEGWEQVLGDLGPRIEAWLLVPWRDGLPGWHPVRDWAADRFVSWRRVEPRQVMVLEGCASASARLRTWASLTVWVEAEPALRLSRGIARDGSHLTWHWTQWQVSEQRHFCRRWHPWQRRRPRRRRIRCHHRPVIAGIGRYCEGVEVDIAQSQVIRAQGGLTPDAVHLIRAMYARSTLDSSDFVWLALAGPSDEELAAVAEVFAIPRLWVADALNPRQRAKAEFSADAHAGLILFKIVSYIEETSSVETGQIALMIGPSYVITMRLGPIGALARVRADITARPDFLAHGPMAAVHAIMDAIVDDYLAVTDEIGRDIDTIEENVFSPSMTDDSEAIYLLKRENLELRRAMSPLVSLAQRLVRGYLQGEIPAPLRTHFHDVGDHLLRAHDSVESYESLLMTMLQASNARLGLQQNTDMRRIAAYAALLAVPTALAGIYGMNFEHMPELTWTYGYPLVLGVMLGLVVAMYRAFKRSNWL